MISLCGRKIFSRAETQRLKEEDNFNLVTTLCPCERIESIELR
jgi:hypothetical protein